MRCNFCIILSFATFVFCAPPDPSAEQNASHKCAGGTLLHGQNNEGLEQRVQELITKRADVNVADEMGWSLLQLAAFNGRQDILEQLIKSGAYINYSNGSGYTALHWAAYRGYDQIIEILLKNGANINLVNINGWTPLHEAVKWGQEKAARVLIRYNANRLIKDKNGKYPADLVTSKKGQTTMTELLTEQNPVNRTASNACKFYSEELEKHVQSLHNRVTGGTLAELGEFQWMVSLGYGNPTNGYAYYCGGVIISEYFVLTAAHCVVPTYKNLKVVRPEPTIVRYGKLSRRDDDGTRAMTREVDLLFRHADHSINENWKNDIGLVRVKNPILFTENVRPACLQTDVRDENPDVKLLVAGFGSISGDQFIRSNDLRKTQVITMPLSQCKIEMERYGISDGHYCAYDPNRRNDSCQGDSGGPLQIPGHDSVEAKVVGIVSFGIGCANGLPGIYSRVAYYLDWIESIVWPRGVISVPKFESELIRSTPNISIQVRHFHDDRSNRMHF